MNVWFAIPSCRPAVEASACFERWRERGYKIAVLRQGEMVTNADLQIPTGTYLGWARSTNILCREILRRDPAASWVIGGGDDYRPDPDHKPHTVAKDCSIYFNGTYGVMQPTGDRWGDDARSREKYGQDRGAYIDRVAGSPWMGREWIGYAYLGNGPMWDGYHHCFADEELQETASMLGVFWQRLELTQYHDHAARDGKSVGEWPAHLVPAITGANWDRDKALFENRKKKGFPGHEPI